jgi:MFS family permease
LYLGINDPDIGQTDVREKTKGVRHDAHEDGQAFLLIRAQNVGLPVAFIPSVLIVMNIVYAFSAYPFGALSDRVAQPRLLGLGIIFLIAANVVLAGAQNVLAVYFGAVLWGLHMGATEGLLSADSCPEDLRGTAFGIFNLSSGIALLLASVVAAWLWSTLRGLALEYSRPKFDVHRRYGLCWIVPGRDGGMGAHFSRGVRNAC